jgi:hypothetical protein
VSNKGDETMNPTPQWLTDYWMARANVSAMTEAQKLELADMVRPYTYDTGYFLFWLRVLCATDYVPSWRQENE